MAGHERLSYYVIVAAAGHDATAASIGGGLQGLLEFPDGMAKLRGNLGLLGTAAEEFVRWTAPVKHFMRTPHKPVEWRGTTIPAGDAIMLAFASACRDEAVFEEPDRPRVDRSPNPHLTFGIGPHFCLGKYLAKMDIEAFYRELLPSTISRADCPSAVRCGGAAVPCSPAGSPR
nr:cytochrome P450 [Azospirillum sp. 412522]